MVGPGRYVRPGDVEEVARDEAARLIDAGYAMREPDPPEVLEDADTVEFASMAVATGGREVWAKGKRRGKRDRS